MKVKLLTVVSLFTLSFIASANTSSEKISAEILDKVVQSYSTYITTEAVKELPKAVLCPGFVEIPDFSTARTNDRGQTLLVDWSDGDQIGGAIFLIQDLKDLAAKKVSTIKAESYGGYWYADGDHYGLNGPVECSLK